MYSLWQLSQETHRAPSEIVRVREWASQMMGFEDTWTPYQFDRAVVWFGIWVENHLAERDKQGKPIHTLDTLLDADKPMVKAGLEFLMANFGVIRK